MKYLFIPLRMPKSGKIFSWLVFCPDGMIYAEETFNDVVNRMDMNAETRSVAA